MNDERRPLFPGSTGCQSATGRIRRGEPVVRGSLPRTGWTARSVYANAFGAAAECYRLAACAPLTAYRRRRETMLSRS